jgi:hypothetical protein
VPAKEDEDNVVGGWYETMRLQASAISASGRGRKLSRGKHCFQFTFKRDEFKQLCLFAYRKN